jgi:hypothetical protein
LGDLLTTILVTDPAPGVANMRAMQMRYQNFLLGLPFLDLVFEGETSIGTISGGIYLRLGLSRSFAYFSRETVWLIGGCSDGRNFCARRGTRWTTTALRVCYRKAELEPRSVKGKLPALRLWKLRFISARNYV